MSSHRRATGTVALAVALVGSLATVAAPAQGATPPKVLRATVYFTASRTITFTAPSRTVLTASPQPCPATGPG